MGNQNPAEHVPSSRGAEASGGERPTDELSSWMEAYAAGSTEAFQKIFAALAMRIQRFHWRSTGNRALSEDLTQQTFLKLHVARRRYRPGWPVVPWIFTIARNIQRDSLRQKQRSREDLADSEEGAPVGDTGPIAEPDPLLRERLEAALQKLPVGQRDVIVLHKFSGLSMEEVAEALDIGLSAAKVRAFRGYAVLREILGAELAPPGTPASSPAGPDVGPLAGTNSAGGPT